VKGLKGRVRMQSGNQITSKWFLLDDKHRPILFEEGNLFKVDKSEIPTPGHISNSHVFLNV